MNSKKKETAENSLRGKPKFYTNDNYKKSILGGINL
jgi:hypothetical protein